VGSKKRESNMCGLKEPGAVQGNDKNRSESGRISCNKTVQEMHRRKHKTRMTLRGMFGKDLRSTE
jgi:hypothetical protein